MMVIGLVFLYGEATLLYRVLKNTNKLAVKIIHAAFHVLAFVCAVIGLVAVFNFHNVQGYPNLYSIHSWCGLTTVVMFGLQLCLGFTGFLWPKFPASMRSAY